MKKESFISLLSLPFLLFFFLMENAKGQPASIPTYEWAALSGGLYGDANGYAVYSDDSGNVFASGEYQGLIDFDPDPNQTNWKTSTYGQIDLFLQKLDSEGNLKWIKTFWGSGAERPNHMTTDDAGNIYITGYFSDSLDLDPGPGSQYAISEGLKDIFIIKLNSSGNYRWGKSIGGPRVDESKSIEYDSYGNIYITGGFEDTVDFNTGPGQQLMISNGNRDAFVLKMDTSGNFKWSISYGSSSTDWARDVAIDPTGNVIVTGSFFYTVDFDPGPGTYQLTPNSQPHQSDFFVQKLDSSGNFQWAISGGNYSNDIGYAVVSDEAGNIYSAGFFKSSVDFNPGPGNNYLLGDEGSLYIQKLNPQGKYRKAVMIKEGGVYIVRSLSCDTANNIILPGYFNDTLDLNPGAGTQMAYSNTMADNFIIKLDSSLNFQWGGVISGGNSESIASSAVTPENDYLFTGDFFNGSFDFDPNEGTVTKHAGSRPSAPVLKLRDCLISFDTISVTTCPNYTVPSGDEVLTTSGQYTDTLLNQLGCDSIITINLTLNNNFDTVQVEACEYFTVPSGDEYYTNSGTYQDTIPTQSGSCDSILTINLTIRQADNTELTLNACSPYTVPSGDESYTQSGTYYDTIPNVFGCDSILKLNLNLIQVDTSVTATKNKLSSNVTAISYQWLDCQKNLSPVNGATGKTFTPSVGGYYAVKVYSQGCTDTSFCHPVYPVGMEKAHGTGLNKAYPNPSRGNFFLEFRVPVSKIRLEVRNIMGKTVRHKTTQMDPNTLKVETGTGSGIYFIQIYYGGQPGQVIRMVKLKN